jgi:hypothetical protein
MIRRLSGSKKTPLEFFKYLHTNPLNRNMQDVLEDQLFNQGRLTNLPAEYVPADRG